MVFGYRWPRRWPRGKGLTSSSYHPSVAALASTDASKIRHAQSLGTLDKVFAPNHLPTPQELDVWPINEPELHLAQNAASRSTYTRTTKGDATARHQPIAGRRTTEAKNAPPTALDREASSRAKGGVQVRPL